MYVRAEDWRAAHRVAVGCMPPDEIRELYVAQVTLPFLVTSLCLHSAMLKTFTNKKNFQQKRKQACKAFATITLRLLQIPETHTYIHQRVLC